MNSKKNILITGGAGFIGSDLAERLLKNENNFIVIVDDLSTGEFRKIPTIENGNGKFIRCDVNDSRDISEVMLSFHFDYIFHYAAVVGVKRTLKNPVKVLSDLHGIENILRLAKNNGVKRVYFSSSSEVYGEPVEIPQNESTTPLNSRLPYAIVKNAGEAFLKSYQREFGLEYTIFRFFNTYGPKQSKDFVVSRFISLALAGKDITIYGDGMQTRTFCYVEDNIDATVNAFYNNQFVNDVVNIGGGNEIPILELARTIIKVTNSKSQITHLAPLKEGDMNRRIPDLTKMNKLLNKTPITLEDGLKRILKNTSYII
jgi:UDP-glucuronate decarboxylase